MTKGTKIPLTHSFARLEFLPNRTPEMAIKGGAEKAFAELAEYRDGAVYVGFYSGNSEWERHPNGDEIVLVLAGSTTLVLRDEGRDKRTPLGPDELFVVPANTWHRFEESRDLKIMTVTPQPTDHRLNLDDA
jgi:mannose-6-phosphate isomerase-like protein (cupin superfamily)